MEELKLFQGLKSNWTNKHNPKKNITFQYFVENPLQAMTAWSLEAMDITKHWVSSLVMLCQIFTTPVFSYCLFVDLSALSFVLSK